MKHFSLLLGLLAGSTAFADEIVLRNGARFTGAVTREAGRVTIRMDSGTMSFAAVDVASVRMADDAFLEMERRTSTASTAQECHDAAVFATANGFGTKAQDLHRRAIELDPEHEGARRALGHVKHEGRWMSFDDLMRERGFVKKGNAWVPPDAVAAEDPLEARAREQELARQRSAEESRIDASLSIELDQLDLEKAHLEQDRKLEARRQRLELLQPAAIPWRTHPHVQDGFRGHEGRREPRPNCGPIWGTTTTRGGPGLSAR
jgi:hypothetical protein